MPQNARLAEDGHGRGVLRWRISSAQTRPPRVGCGAAFMPDRRAAFLGHIIFQVEGGLVTYRMRWPLGAGFAANATSSARVPIALRPDARRYTPPQRDQGHRERSVSGLRPTWRRSTPLWTAGVDVLR